MGERINISFLDGLRPCQNQPLSLRRTMYADSTVLSACASENIAVPEEVAVIGVDNDELLCGLCNPPLSSVIPDPERIGFEAASRLDQMMAVHAA